MLRAALGIVPPMMRETAHWFNRELQMKDPDDGVTPLSSTFSRWREKVPQEGGYSCIFGISAIRGGQMRVMHPTDARFVEAPP
jgi:hypothetical protein